MKRFDVVDGLRGYFLVFMMVNHLVFRGGGSWLHYLNHNKLGYVEDAQGFVFLSGFVVGLVYLRMIRRGDEAQVDSKLISRAAKLYRYHVVLVGLMLAAALLMPWAAAAWSPLLGRATEYPLAYALAGTGLLYQPFFMDILPQYMTYLVAAPFLVRLVAAGRWLQVMAGSGLLWIAAQLGLHLPLVNACVAVVGRVIPGFHLEGFNLLGWQLVFVSGLVLGGAAQGKTIDLDRWFPTRRPLLLQASLALGALFLAFRVAFTLGWASNGPLASRFLQHLNRGEFSLVYLLNFAADAYVVTWLLVAGRRAAWPVTRGAAAVLGRVFTLRLLTFLGRHSLQVYAFHVLVAYAVFAVDAQFGPLGQPSKCALTLLAAASLLVPAWLHERHQSVKKGQASIAAGPAGT